MRKKIYSQEIIPKGKPPKAFAVFPTIVNEAHSTQNNKWLIWLEWYELDLNEKWLLK